MIKINKKSYDKWIISKNNWNWKRSISYVDFVISWFKKNNEWPTTKNYINNIVDFLVNDLMNNKYKLTDKRHQLYVPLFFGFLKLKEYKNKIIVLPTKLGAAASLDYNGLDKLDIMFLIAINNISLGNGSQGNKKYEKINPAKELINNLIKKGEISFHELNSKFNYDTPGTNIDFINENDTSKDPSWNYLLKFLEEAKLISTDTSFVCVSKKMPQNTIHLEKFYLQIY